MKIAELETAFDKMDLADLRIVPRLVALKIAERENAEKDAVKAELAELAKSKGFEMSDLFGSGPAVRKERKTVAPKYRNPVEGSQTWTGRGRRPKWLEEALSSGGTLEDFLIKD